MAESQPAKPAPLKPNAVLFKIARAQAAKLAAAEKLDENLDEKKLGALLSDGGYKFQAKKIGANQAADKDIQPNAAFQAWIDYRVAREILMEPNEDAGIGIVKSDKGDIFYVMICATPDK